MSPFHARTAGPISAKFCTDLPTNSRKLLNTSMTPPTQPLDPGVLQNPNGSRERKLCVTQNVEMGDVSSLNFFQAAPGPGWLVKNKKMNSIDLVKSHMPLKNDSQ